MLNDETYYWDWSRNLQLSYIDAPPAISWVAYLGTTILTGSLGARLFVSLLFFGTSLFLINSYKILSLKSKKDQIKSYFYAILDNPENIVLFMLTAIPVFNMHGILLMPDAPLLFAEAGALYFALKAYNDSKNSYDSKLKLMDGLFLGLFLGLGVASKYQGGPIAIALFLAIVVSRGIKTTLLKDYKFWIVTIFCALIVASPLLIWNIQHDFASFKFQGQHGFAAWKLSPIRFSLYLISVLAALMPWYSWLFLKQLYHSIFSKKLFKSIEIIPIFAFFSIFLFIGGSALGGGETQVHWMTPAFLFLIPVVVSSWDSLVLNKKLWKKINFISILLCCFAGALVFTPMIQNLFSSKQKIFGYQISKIHNGLYRNLNWSKLNEPLKTFEHQIPNFSKVEKPYFTNLNKTKCSQEPYLASFSWRWASQFAFYLPNQPRVFSFNLGHANYYAWRDDLKNLAGCKVWVLGERHMYKPNELGEFMFVLSEKSFVMLSSYTHDPVEMIFIEGQMKDAKTLRALSEKLISNPEY